MFICAISNTPNPIVRCFSFRLVDTFSISICLNYTLRGSQSSRNFWRRIVESKLIYLFYLSSILMSSMNTFHIFLPTSQGVIKGTISGSLNTTFGRLSSDQTKSTSSPAIYSGSGSCEYTHRADPIHAFMYIFPHLSSLLNPGSWLLAPGSWLLAPGRHSKCPKSYTTLFQVKKFTPKRV